ncbi:site-specific integrase [Actinoplanes sp. CA-054009]
MRGKTEAIVTRKVRDLKRERDRGTVRKVGQRWTVATWLTQWVENIAAPAVRETTMVGYRSAVYKHLISGVGAHRLEKLEPEHLKLLYAAVIRRGSAPGTAHQTRRTVKTALNVAVRRGHLARNVARLAKPPRLDEQEIEPFTVAEAQRLLEVAAEKRNGVRFALALALGLRKGEALGLKWRRIDLEKGPLRTPRQLQRHRWQHGCGDPNECGTRLHKTTPCSPNCRRHQPACPPCARRTASSTPANARTSTVAVSRRLM